MLHQMQNRRASVVGESSNRDVHIIMYYMYTNRSRLIHADKLEKGCDQVE